MAKGLKRYSFGPFAFLCSALVQNYNNAVVTNYFFGEINDSRAGPHY